MSKFKEDLIETFTSGDWRVSIAYDSDCTSPREDMSLSFMLTWRSGYLSPDGQAGSWYDLQEFEDWYDEQEKGERWVRLPLIPRYYDGGYGIASEQDVVEGRHVGWIFTTAETVEEVGAPVESLERQLRAEVDEYNLWADVKCYGYVIEHREGACSCGECYFWAGVDSCWGFIGKIWDINYPDDFPDSLKDELRKSGYLGEGV